MKGVKEIKEFLTWLVLLWQALPVTWKIIMGTFASSAVVLSWLSGHGDPQILFLAGLGAFFSVTLLAGWLVQQRGKTRTREIRTKADLNAALSLYEHRMPPEDQHPLSDIRCWWAQEQKRKPEQCESREIFLLTKAEGRICHILFATYSRGFVNIYAFARDKFEPRAVGKNEMESELLDRIRQIVDRLPQCNGMLIEISHGIPARESVFNNKLRRFGMKLEPVTQCFTLPDLTHKCDPNAEKQATLYYVPKDEGKRFDLHSTSGRNFLIGEMYEIYAESFPDDPRWRAYIADLKGRVLAEHQPSASPPKGAD